MAVDAVNSATSAASAATSASAKDAKAATLDYSSFLKLLIAQMKSQDPTDPMDASQQLSQLATFSQVEQSIKTNTHLESLLTKTSMNSAASYIGKTITSLDGTVSGVVASVQVTADGATATTTTGKKIDIVAGVTIRDTSLSAPSEAASFLGQTITGSNGTTSAVVTAVTLTADGAYASTADNSVIAIEKEVAMSSTIKATGYAGSYLLGKTLTSADGLTSGVVDSLTETADGIFARTANGKTIVIESGVKIGQATA